MLTEKLGTERTSVVVMDVTGTDIELVEFPKWESQDDDGVQIVNIPDDEAEIVIDAVRHESDGAGSFVIHNGDGVAKGKSISYSANPGSFALPLVGQRMGKGNPVLCDPTITDGTLRVWVEYHVERSPHRKQALTLLDA